MDIALLNNFQVDTFRHYCLYSHFLERVTKEEKTLASAWPEELKLKQLDNDLLDDEDDDYYEEDYEEDDDLYDDEDDDDYYDDEEYYEDEYSNEGEKVKHLSFSHSLEL